MPFLTYRGPKLLKKQSAIKKRKAKFEYDWLTCACNNDAMYLGFYEATKSGNAKKEQYRGRHSGWYGCNHCGAILKTPKGFPFNSEKTTLVPVTKFATEAQLLHADEVQNPNPNKGEKK